MATLKVLNLNIMHGRNARSSTFPPVTKRAAVEATLSRITEVVRRHDPDIVTLQEVDGYSWFNGRLDQLAALRKQLDYPYAHLADNFRVSLSGVVIHRTGVAILSRYSLSHVASHDFPRSFPTPRKGFCIVRVNLPGGVSVTVASVHMVWIDWLRSDSRMRQARVLVNALRIFPGPMLVAGDFNCRLVDTSEKTLPFLMDTLDLKAFAPESRTMDTWPSWQPTERDDWILASRSCRFLAHETFNDRHSDHLAIAATVEILN